MFLNVRFSSSLKKLSIKRKGDIGPDSQHWIDHNQETYDEWRIISSPWDLMSWYFHHRNKNQLALSTNYNLQSGNQPANFQIRKKQNVIDSFHDFELVLFGYISLWKQSNWTHSAKVKSKDHLVAFFWWNRFIWVFNDWGWLKRVPHRSQWYGFSPVCRFKWTFKWYGVANRPSHIVQAWGLTLLCTIKCFL